VGWGREKRNGNPYNIAIVECSKDEYKREMTPK
jgi:hypothetical protein